MKAQQKPNRPDRPAVREKEQLGRNVRANKRVSGRRGGKSQELELVKLE